MGGSARTAREVGAVLKRILEQSRRQKGSRNCGWPVKAGGKVYSLHYARRHKPWKRKAGNSHIPLRLRRLWQKREAQAITSLAREKWNFSQPGSANPCSAKFAAYFWLSPRRSC